MDGLSKGGSPGSDLWQAIHRMYSVLRGCDFRVRQLDRTNFDLADRARPAIINTGTTSRVGDAEQPCGHRGGWFA